MPRPKGPHYPYQGKIASFYVDEETKAIIKAESERTGQNLSETLRRIIADWKATQNANSQP